MAIHQIIEKHHAIQWDGTNGQEIADLVGMTVTEENGSHLLLNSVFEILPSGWMLMTKYGPNSYGYYLIKTEDEVTYGSVMVD